MKDTAISENPKQIFNRFRSELISRLLAQACKYYGANDDPFEVNHISKRSDRC